MQKIKKFFNNTHRQAYSSSRFITLKSNANGYFLNTLQFYLSNFILVLIIFGAGNLLFKLLKARKYSVKSFFVRFRFWLTFPIVLFESNIQYMTYLMGFELKNLWALSPLDKTFSSFILTWLFVFVLSMSAIHFLIKYIHKHLSRESFENCHPSLKGVFYMNFFSGIRNITLGFLHQILPDGEKSVHVKLAYLAFVELLFLAGIVYLIQRSFFISKLKQWVTIGAVLVRVSVMMLFLLDINVKGHD